MKSELLDAKARDCLMDLLSTLIERNAVSRLYESLFRRSIDALDANPEQVLHEVFAFGAFALTVNATQYIRKWRFFLRSVPDERGADVFASFLFDHLTAALNSHPRRESFTYYRANRSSTPFPVFGVLSSIPPDRPAFEVAFINHKFLVPLFATRLEDLLAESVLEHRLSVDSEQVVAFGYRLVELAADVTRNVFVR
jgi:hypothetical protein